MRFLCSLLLIVIVFPHGVSAQMMDMHDVDHDTKQPLEIYSVTATAFPKDNKFVLEEEVRVLQGELEIPF